MSCALASRWVETLWQSITAGTFYVSVSVIPSGKRLHNYGKIQHFNGKTHYFNGHFQ